MEANSAYLKKAFDTKDPSTQTEEEDGRDSFSPSKRRYFNVSSCLHMNKVKAFHRLQTFDMLGFKYWALNLFICL